MPLGVHCGGVGMFVCICLQGCVFLVGAWQVVRVCVCVSSVDGVGSHKSVRFLCACVGV